MRPTVRAGTFGLLVALAMGGLSSCHSLQTSLSPGPESWPDITPTQLEYVDTDGFDALLETALVNQDPVIVIRTGRSQPDWTGRLNAWIAAWNRGSQAARKPGRRAAGEGEPSPTVRGQSPLPKVTLDGESIRELRLLVGGLLDRVEELAQSGSAWWAEERARSRRIALLKQYSLRFHLDEEGLIHLVFFHGSYSSYYSRFVQQLTRASTMTEIEWSRSLECSCCRRSGRRDMLTGRAESE